MNINRYEGDINFEMTGVGNPPLQDQWTLALQRQLISQVTPQALAAARARYTADPRDSSTPNEMARFLGRLQLGDLLPPAPTRMMLDLMSRSKTGPARLKGKLPKDIVVAHKTGTTDVVMQLMSDLITLPDDGAIKGHLALAVFVTDGRVSAMQQTIAELAGAAFSILQREALAETHAQPSAAQAIAATALQNSGFGQMKIG